MSDTAWAYLPNAKHIDAVLADVQKRPEAWDTAADISWIAGTFTKQKLLDDEREAAWKASRAAIFSLARTRAMSAVCDVLDAPETSDVFSVGTDVTDALIAWDPCAIKRRCFYLTPSCVVTRNRRLHDVTCTAPPQQPVNHYTLFEE